MSAQTTHRFSFVVTNHNFERYLGECLDSLAYQNYSQEDYQIVCVDDGSTDGSKALIEKYKKRFANFTPVFIANSGLEKACNQGIKAARFDWIVRADADDRLDPEFLPVMNRAMNKTAADFYYCKEYYEFYSDNERTKKTLPDFDAEEIFGRGDFFATGTVYRKRDLDAIGGFPEAVKNCGLENYSVILAFLKAKKKGLAVPGTWFDYRRHRANMSTLRRDAIVEFGHELLKRYGRPFVTNDNHPYGLKLETKS